MNFFIDVNNWPLAIKPDSIPKTKDDFEYRTRYIVELFIEHEIKGKFLDFGCGDGSVANYVKKYADLSIGYDIKKNWKEEKENLTTEYSFVIKNGPYDTILLFDVLDHCENPYDILNKIVSLLSYKGRLYIRRHPWNSRHATHCPDNLAYKHLFTEKQDGIFHNRYPIFDNLYHYGLKILKKREIKENVEYFFKIFKPINELPGEIQYIDYIFEKYDIKLK